MAIDAIVGIVSAVAGAAADVGAAILPEAAAAGAADVAATGAIALPEIAVTAAAPEVAAGVGTEALLGGASLAGVGAGLAGGFGAGA